VPMLKELSIQNLAIIDNLSVSFVEGLTVISGETGAGKSIIIGAVGLLLGERASTDFIRSSEDSAVIEALFDIRGKNHVKDKLNNMGYGSDDELVVKRVVSRTGKNRIYINGNLTTLSMLSSLSEELVNICSQHEHQTILNADNHIDIIDEFGGLIPRRAEYSDLFIDYQSLKEKLSQLKSINRKKQEREEFLTFQLKEIEEGDIKQGEDLSLQEERNILSNAKKLGDCANESHEILYAGEGTILEKLAFISQRIQEINEIDTRFSISKAELDSIYFSLEDVSFRLRDYMGGILFDPARLDEIDERLAYLRRLKRKYGGTLDDVFQKKNEIREELNTISSVEEEIERISEEIIRKKKLALEKARALSQQRRVVAKQLAEDIEHEINTLRMANTTFDVRFTLRPDDDETEPLMHSKGIDAVEFYLSTNVGEELKPLNRIASGGELSRIILAMKKVLARTGSVSTIIFDEVDTGIGGATAEIVGKKLQDVSEHHQVICITHLPQIVCFGKNHFLVSKHVSGDRTKTEMRILSEAERLEEITRMLGGVEVTQKTREHAHEMLRAAHNK
jgi:DNA repair protein RecN (Recombination protein N)